MLTAALIYHYFKARDSYRGKMAYHLVSNGAALENMYFSVLREKLCNLINKIIVVFFRIRERRCVFSPLCRRIIETYLTHNVSFIYNLILFSRRSSIIFAIACSSLDTVMRSATAFSSSRALATAIPTLAVFIISISLS